MNFKKAKHILIGLLVICALSASYFVYNQRTYDEISALIDIDEMDAMAITYIKNDVVLFETEAYENASYIEINDEDVIVVDNEKLFNILAKYETRRSRKDYFPFEEDFPLVKISLSQNNKPKHLLLGAFNIWYESQDGKVFDIIDGDKLLEEISALVESERNVNHDYAFESLLGKTRNEVISIFGEDYRVTDQGVNQQNIGLAYDEFGVLVGLDRKNDKVVEVQLKDVEYKGISTKLRMGTADDIMDMEMLTINLMLNFNQSPIWYVYDFASYKVRISGQSRGSLIEELVIFKESL